MIDHYTKEFINEIVLGAADELRAMLNDYSVFQERMYEKQLDKMDELIGVLDKIDDTLDEMLRNLNDR